jgi:hypothetical protein
VDKDVRFGCVNETPMTSVIEEIHRYESAPLEGQGFVSTGHDHFAAAVSQAAHDPRS